MSTQLDLDLAAEKTLDRMLNGTAEKYQIVLTDFRDQLQIKDRAKAKDILDNVIKYYEGYRVTRIRSELWIIRNNTQRERMKEYLEHVEWFERVMNENEWRIEFDRFKRYVREDRMRLGLLSNISTEYGVYVVGGYWTRSGKECRGGKMYRVGPFIDRTEMSRCRREIIAIVDEQSCTTLDGLKNLLHDVCGYSWSSIKFAIQKENVAEFDLGKGLYRRRLGEFDVEGDA